MARVPFKRIRERAAKRKGGEKVLASLLPGKQDVKALAQLPDDRVLSEMARRIFSAGFVWSVIDKKWPGFEECFLGFDPRRLLFQPAEFWEKLASDKRIVRNPQKIRSVRENAKFVSDIAAERGSFGKFLADWPADDQIGLLEILDKRGSRLGGFSGQYLLRFLGRDSYILTNDLILCLRDSGVPLSAKGTSKKDMKLAQAQINEWAKETGLPLTDIQFTWTRLSAMADDAGYSRRVTGIRSVPVLRTMFAMRSPPLPRVAQTSAPPSLPQGGRPRFDPASKRRKSNPVPA